MQGKYNFFLRHFNSLTTSSEPLVYIMLSGLPCTGKSTWREKIVNILAENGISVLVISSDDIAYTMRDEFNQNNTSSNTITYTDICTTHRAELEERYRKAVVASTTGHDVVILDRTYLTSDRREKVLNLISPNPTHIVSLTIQNESEWEKRLAIRNSSESDKMIDQNIINYLKQGMEPPTKKEGFASVSTCCAVGEPGWENEFDKSITEIIKKLPAKDNQQAPMCTYI